MRCAVLALCSATGIYAQDTAGYVIAMRGGWMAGPTALAAGRPVFRGSRIEPKDAAGSITVAFLDGSAKTFTATFSVEARPAAVSGTGRMLAAVAKAMKPGERPAVYGMSRGAAEIHPAVLQLRGKRLDLAPAMGAMASAEYAVELLDATGAVAAASKCNFDAPAATSATVTPLAGV